MQKIITKKNIVNSFSDLFKVEFKAKYSKELYDILEKFISSKIEIEVENESKVNVYKKVREFLIDNNISADGDLYKISSWFVELYKNDIFKLINPQYYIEDEFFFVRTKKRKQYALLIFLNLVISNKLYYSILKKSFYEEEFCKGNFYFKINYDKKIFDSRLRIKNTMFNRQVLGNFKSILPLLRDVDMTDFIYERIGDENLIKERINLALDNVKEECNNFLFYIGK